MVNKPNTAKAVKTGKSMAIKAVEELDAARKRREAALTKAKLVKRGPARLAKPMLSKSSTTHASKGTLIAEGDSWFDYPLHDVLSGLDDLGFDVESVAHKGDTVEEMAYSDGQLVKFSRLVDKVLRSGVRPRAILISGGGNDVAGDEFAMLLNHAASGRPPLNDSIVNGVIEERVRDAYTAILTKSARLSPAKPFPLSFTAMLIRYRTGAAFSAGSGFCRAPGSNQVSARRAIPTRRRTRRFAPS
jgi:hypothetical protein